MAVVNAKSPERHGTLLRRSGHLQNLLRLAMAKLRAVSVPRKDSRPRQEGHLLAELLFYAQAATSHDPELSELEPLCVLVASFARELGRLLKTGVALPCVE